MLYSSAFHRLAGITQIVRAGEADVFHTRQQHTIKVAQVGRRLGQKLLAESPTEANYRGLDPEVVEAACLAHDLGHPPFGHIGEETLHKLVLRGGDTDGFEGNAQSFRVMTKLAVRFDDVDGIDLTRATLSACLKYPWFKAAEGKAAKKWSAYRSEDADFQFAREFHRHDQKTLEAELMDWADDVAYSVHDLEDFHRCNALPWRRVFEDRASIIQHALGSDTSDSAKESRLQDAYERLYQVLQGTFGELMSTPYEGAREQREQLRRMTSWLIGKYINSVRINPDRSSPQSVLIEPDDVDEVQILKQITRDYIIASPTLAAQQHGQKQIIEGLFTALADEAQSSYPSFLPKRLRYLYAMADRSVARFVADCISSLSESEAVALHGRLTGMTTGSVLDPIVR